MRLKFTKVSVEMSCQKFHVNLFLIHSAALIKLYEYPQDEVSIFPYTRCLNVDTYDTDATMHESVVEQMSCKCMAIEFTTKFVKIVLKEFIFYAVAPV